MKRLMAVLAMVLGGCGASTGLNLPDAAADANACLTDCAPRPDAGCALGMRCIDGNWEQLFFSCEHCTGTTPFCHDDGVAVSGGIALGVCDIEWQGGNPCHCP